MHTVALYNRDLLQTLAWKDYYFLDNGQCMDSLPDTAFCPGDLAITIDPSSKIASSSILHILTYLSDFNLINE